jgi:hypothetical protein
LALARQAYSVAIPLSPAIKATMMHITTLRAGQMFNSYLKAGARLHLTAGAIQISEAPSWGDAHGFFHETTLSEGATYQVQRSGWLLIKASRNTEFLLEVPEPVQFWRHWLAVKQTWRKLLAGLGKKTLTP